MRRGTTPTLSLQVNANLVEWTCYVSINHGGTITTFEDDRLTKTLDDGVTTIDITLTQEETLAFNVGSVEMQIRAIDGDTAIATNIVTLPVDRIILDGVIVDE